MSLETLRRLSVLAIVMIPAWASTPSRATTFVMTTDDELLERAELVVVGMVSGVESAPGVELPATDYVVEVERPLRGFAPAGTLLVRVPGGVRPDGLGLFVFGAPRFEPGDRVLLFLAAGETGTYRLVESALGAFRETKTVDGHKVAIRDLGHAGFVDSLALPEDPLAAARARSHLPRDFAGFESWLDDRVLGVERSADYFLDGSLRNVEPALVGASSRYTVLTSSASNCGANGGHPIRWREFDQNLSVGFRAHQGGQPNVAGGGFTQVRDAMAAWSRDSNSEIRLVYSGTSAKTNAAGAPDGENLIVFEDKGGEIPGSYTGGGGTLASGFFYFNCLLFPFAQGMAHPILEAGIVIQDGVGANLFSRLPRPDLTLGEILAHEQGHTLGVGHSCGDSSSPSCKGALDNATMRASLHNDDRGASIRPDDLAAAAFLYGSTATVPQAPKPPSGLLVTVASTAELDLSWSDGSSNETGFEIEERELGADWRQIAVVGSNTVALRVGSLAEASFRTYRVRAVNAAGASSYSNEASGTTRATPGVGCVEDGSTLCLNRNRFKMTVRFRNGLATSGSCQAVELSDDTGLCWFFQPENIELVVKALDGCDVNGHYWVFAGGLTNVELELTAVDTTSGEAHTYVNPDKTAFRPVQDAQAFGGCPGI